jgi:tetratricopeptide (TPR) repeat protein
MFVARHAAMKTTTLFLSCVSDEFHKEDKSADPAFFSWRTHLERSLNALERGNFVVITQETTLESEQGDLLEVLEKAVRRSDYVIHLYGDLCGITASERSLRLLRERCSNFLSDEPEIQCALPAWEAISYTQWELYFTLHYRCKPLIYLAEENAPRSPFASAKRGDTNVLQSRDRHLAVIRATGQTRPRIRNQDHLANLVYIKLLKAGSFEREGWARSSAEALAAASGKVGGLLRQFAARLRVGLGPASGGPAPFRARDSLEAAEHIAAQAGIAAPELLELIEAHREEQRAAASAPAFVALYELAFTELALADLPAALTHARQAADAALAAASAAPADSAEATAGRDQALQALLLLHDLARLDHDLDRSLAALEEGSTLLDWDRDPLAWADYHQLLADFLDTIGHHQQAFEWMCGTSGQTPEEDIPGVLDIFETAYGSDDEEKETEPKLAEALLLLSRIQCFCGDAQGARSLAGRARRIWLRQLPRCERIIGECLIREGEASKQMGDLPAALEFGERAVTLFRLITDQERGNHLWQQNLAVSLKIVGWVRNSLGDFPAALELSLEALEIWQRLADEDPDNRCHLRDMAMALGQVGQVRENLGQSQSALALFLQSLEICQALTNEEPSNQRYQRSLALCLNQVAEMQERLGAYQVALDYFLPALEISQRLADREPSNPTLQHDLATALEQFAQVQVLLGQSQAAMPASLQLLAIRERLAGEEPENLNLRRAVAVAFNRLGYNLESAGDRTGAIERYRSAHAILDDLHQADPSNAPIHHALYLNACRLGFALALKSPDLRREAFKYLRDAADLARAMQRVNSPHGNLAEELVVIEQTIAKIREKA